MSFLDELGESVAGMAKDIGGKARELSGTAKIHANIKAEEVRIQELYYKLGKKYYEVYSEAPDTGVADFIDKIKEANEKIREYKEDLEAGKEEVNVVVDDAPSPEDIRTESKVVNDTVEAQDSAEKPEE